MGTPAQETGPAPESTAAPAPEATPPPAEGAPAPEQAAAPEPEAKPEPAKDPLHRGFAALTRKEEKLRQREAALKAQEAETRTIRETLEKAKADPRALFGLLGEDLYERLTHAILEDGQEPTPEKKIAELEKRIEAKERAEAEERAKLQAAQAERQMKAARAEIAQLAAGDADRYEAVNAYGVEAAADEALEVIRLYFDKHAKDLPEDRRHEAVLPFDEALDLVESHLLENARKFQQLKKLAPKQAPAPTPPAEAKERQDSGARESSSPTLTNRGATDGTPPPSADGDDLPLDPVQRNQALAKRYALWT